MPLSHGELPKLEVLQKTWDNLLVKIERKAEIECGIAKLDSLKQKQDEEKSLYADEECGKEITHQRFLRITMMLKTLNVSPHLASELHEAHCVSLLAPRAKTGLIYRFEVNNYNLNF